MYRTHRTWRGVDGGYHFRGSGAWRLETEAADRDRNPRLPCFEVL
jgi:hypothetical protein